MSWHDGPMLAFDTETTGKDPLTARIVTACVATVVVPTNTIAATEWLINPGVEIPDEATNIHSVTTEMAQLAGRPPAEALGEIVELVEAAWAAGTPVVGHNVVYDLTLLDAELARHQYAPLSDGPVIDTFLLDKQTDRYRKGKRTLTAACEHHRIPLPEAHNATADAVAAARLAWRLACVFPELAAMSLPDLHTAQIGWAVEQAVGLRDYFVSKGRDEDAATVDGAWPIRRHTVAAS